MDRINEIRLRLAETRRRLGPYAALQSIEEPYRCADAEIARRLVETVQAIDALAEEVIAIAQRGAR